MSVQTIRYRDVTHVHHFQLPFAFEATITRESWRLLSMSDNILNDSQWHRQEDELAMKFFAKKF
jgi:hypothetical protein